MSRAQISILIVDDHAMFRESLAGLMPPFIRVVGLCGDGLKVLPMVQDLRPDVVVIDISMPGWNGLDACQQIKRAFPDVRVLILTMHNDKNLVVRAMEHGASGYLLKESGVEQLVEAIQQAASGGLYIDPRISPSALQLVGQGQGDSYERLTPREKQVLQLITESKSNRLIAQELGLSAKTVDVHRTRLMRKLGIHDQTTLVKYALQKGIVIP